MPALRASILATVAVLASALAACGSTSHPQSTSTSSTTAPQTRSTGTTTTQSKPPASAAARKLEHGLLGAGPRRPTSATCLPATAADRRASPFGGGRSPVFSCVITVAGTKARYYVQVLKSGCFVAERRRAGRAIYGCGAS